VLPVLELLENVALLGIDLALELRHSGNEFGERLLAVHDISGKDRLIVYRAEMSLPVVIGPY
jgi:hypothetical protein